MSYWGANASSQLRPRVFRPTQAVGVNWSITGRSCGPPRSHILNKDAPPAERVAGSHPTVQPDGDINGFLKDNVSVFSLIGMRSEIALGLHTKPPPHSALHLSQAFFDSIAAMPGPGEARGSRPGTARSDAVQDTTPGGKTVAG
eukprot:CAMPEP_0180176830 /NCGR_PEP_ID=MMETSP0986-20121125/37503_1 /TAXON_ID=697907 /ORGANISM="non described non described, Strain CCMP2293" /LENGTH=143 /DNA_ID=CAMNT_0022129481 /DNA_START=14 /DNA_END=441 /DNA_ORIENTATION=+